MMPHSGSPPRLTPSEIISSIQTQQRTSPLKILGYAESLLQLHHQPQPHTLSQSQSQPLPASDLLTPSTLTTDLAHYRDLFSKLRFSYTEQKTKEEYIRSIVGQDPSLNSTSTSANGDPSSASSNAALEMHVAQLKADLQTKKRATEALIAEMEGLARTIARKYDAVSAGMVELEVLPAEVEGLESVVQELRRQVREVEGEGDGVDSEIGEHGEDDARVNLSLEETTRLIEEQTAREEELKLEIEDLERELLAKTRESERAVKEVEEMEGRRNEVTRAVRDLQRRKQEGGRDLLEEQGRWYQSSHVVMKELLGM